MVFYIASTICAQLLEGVLFFAVGEALFSFGEHFTTNAPPCIYAGTPQQTYVLFGQLFNSSPIPVFLALDGSKMSVICHF
jgi:hypothetical protein